MINLKVIKTPNLLNLGEINVNLPNITIGKQLKNTIVIDDPEFKNQVLKLTLNKKGLFITSSSFMTINGKSIKGNIKLKDGHTFSAGNTVIKVLSFDSSNLPDDDQYYKDLEIMSIEQEESYKFVEAFESEYAVELGKIDELES